MYISEDIYADWIWVGMLLRLKQVLFRGIVKGDTDLLTGEMEPSICCIAKYCETL